MCVGVDMDSNRTIHGVGMWTCGLRVDLWTPCGPVNVWTCGPVDVWTCGPVDLWTCGSVDEWTCGPGDDKLFVDSRKVLLLDGPGIYACYKMSRLIMQLHRINLATS